MARQVCQGEVVSVRFRLAAEKAVKQMARWDLIRVAALAECNTNR